jgi:hypothetical protein
LGSPPFITCNFAVMWLCEIPATSTTSDSQPDKTHGDHNPVIREKHNQSKKDGNKRHFVLGQVPAVLRRWPASFREVDRAQRWARRLLLARLPPAFLTFPSNCSHASTATGIQSYNGMRPNPCPIPAPVPRGVSTSLLHPSILEGTLGTS